MSSRAHPDEYVSGVRSCIWRRYQNVKGEALGFPSGCCLALCDDSVQAYSDLSWLDLIGFGNLYFKYSVAIGCFDVIVFHGLR
jgi:hypothetical protein